MEILKEIFVNFLGLCAMGCIGGIVFSSIFAIAALLAIKLKEFFFCILIGALSGLFFFMFAQLALCISS